MSVISEEELQELVESYAAEKGIYPELISIGYVYTETGERWFFNGDKNYYSASLYKVPLMMLYAEKEADGELSRESEIFGMTLSYIEEEVLTYSNNSIAYSMLCHLGEPSSVRAMFQRYSDLPEDYYSWDFCSYSFFTARFMTDVMQTLYERQERFPNILDCLKQAQPGHYFRLGLGDEEFQIAQKYGSYHDETGYDWNHTAGVIYTEHPFILTVMTKYGGVSEIIISDMAVLFKDYTLKADGRLEEYREREAEAERERLRQEAEEKEKAKAKAETPEPTGVSTPIPSQDETVSGTASTDALSPSRLVWPAAGACAVPVGLAVLFGRKRKR